jgi:hypothetical protein
LLPRPILYFRRRSTRPNAAQGSGNRCLTVRLSQCELNFLATILGLGLMVRLWLNRASRDPEVR